MFKTRRLKKFKVETRKRIYKKVVNFIMLVPRTAILTCSIYVLLNCLTHELCQATAIPDITTSSPHTTTKGYKTPQAEILEDEVS